MACETPKQSRVVSQAHNPNQSKGHANKDSNTGNETTDVEDSDKTQSIEDQNEPEEKLLENKNDKKIEMHLMTILIPRPILKKMAIS